ncbi:hypothetical protein [uncultured Alteromonas sp.]|jgi:hypothetical protein|uniref:hypothetical protein n=1 Tax=uncultured Alteromonas sp. TaxID=179113 RepID=UPI0025CE35CB|nr:hypothetical protein [uncultured Alteromonas sp.]
MDVNNQLLKELLHKTDIAFRALLDEPASLERQSAYDEAKIELDRYVVKFREQLQFRNSQKTR